MTRNSGMMKPTRISNKNFLTTRQKPKMATYQTRQLELERQDQRKKHICTVTPSFTQQFSTKSRISSSLLVLVETKCVFLIGKLAALQLWFRTSRELSCVPTSPINLACLHLVPKTRKCATSTFKTEGHSDSLQLCNLINAKLSCLLFHSLGSFASLELLLF